VQPSGADIRFADASGERLLPFEVEEFDRARQRLVAWVKVPELATGPQMVAYLYYGNLKAAAAVNAQPVWDAHYEAVWHMNPRKVAQDGVLADSTTHAHAGILRNMHSSSVDTARGIAFDGRGGSIEVADWPGLRSAGDWTVEFSIQHAPTKKRNFAILDHGDAVALNLYLHNEGFLVVERRNEGRISEIGLSRELIPPSEWVMVVVTRTRHHVRLATDGVTRSAYPVDPEFTDSGDTAPLKIGIGRLGPFDGRLAELRISRGIARSADWILASFRSQAGSFVEVGAPESR
jgi:biopolymer transport protein ExbB